MTTTGYLSDGRTVNVPDRDVKDWRYEVENGDTTLGLGDWFTDCGDENTELIEGTADDNPRCDHHEPDELDPALNSVRVTNESQLHRYDPTKSHASTRVCGRRVCVLDAMAHVERFTGERALWTFRLGDTDDWRSLPPESDVEATVFDDLRFPLSAEIAGALEAKLGDEFVVRVPLDGLLEAVANANLDQNVIPEDWIHPQVLSFGSPYDCTWRLLTVDGANAVIKYTTSLAEALTQHRELTSE